MAELRRWVQEGRLGRLDRRSESVLRWFGRVGVPVLACLVLFIGVRDLRPAYAVQFASGTPGTFTATERHCGRTCTWTGDFVSDDGAVVRRDVQLTSGGDVDRVGDRIAAVDTGNRYSIYPRNGGWDWLLITIFLW